MSGGGYGGTVNPANPSFGNTTPYQKQPQFQQTRPDSLSSAVSGSGFANQANNLISQYGQNAPSGYNGGQYQYALDQRNNASQNQLHASASAQPQAAQPVNQQSWQYNPRSLYGYGNQSWGGGMFGGYGGMSPWGGMFGGYGYSPFGSYGGGYGMPSYPQFSAYQQRIY